jgi:hypothetical protein
MFIKDDVDCGFQFVSIFIILCIDSALLFGEEGILNAEDSYQFEQRSAAASTLMVSLSNEFLQYFNKTLKPKLLINFNNLGTEGLNSANRWTKFHCFNTYLISEVVVHIFFHMFGAHGSFRIWKDSQ